MNDIYGILGTPEIWITYRDENGDWKNERMETLEDAEKAVRTAGALGRDKLEIFKYFRRPGLAEDESGNR